jgi:hypothetical protein
MIKKFWMIVMLMCGVGAGCAQVLRVGDLVTMQDGTQGIVYYLNPDGSGGWVVALFDASLADCRWGTSSNVPDLADQNPPYEQELLLDTAGYANTQKIRAHYNDDLPYAAGMVDFEHGWVLPSPAQLQMLYAQLPFVSPALVAVGGRDLSDYPYWSSAEADDNLAWALFFGGGYAGFLYKESKYSTYRVRAVRSFTYPLYLWNTKEGSSSIVVMPNQTTDYSVAVRTGYASVASAETTIATKPSFDTIVAETACDSYTWNGVTYTQSGVHTVHYSAANGCDSAVTLMLTVNHPPEISTSTITAPGCPGDSVTLQATANPVFTLPVVAIGDILCTDGTIEKPAAFLNSGKTAMGVVFQVDCSGQHGWAVHLHDQGLEVIWGGCNLEIPNAPVCMYNNLAIKDTSGYLNTAAIRAVDGASVFPAAYAVDFLHGWYLPADGQLHALFAEFVNVNASLQMVGGTPFPIPQEDEYFNYWSSSVSDLNYAWFLDCSGGAGRTYRQYTGRVRAVRSF